MSGDHQAGGDSVGGAATAAPGGRDLPATAAKLDRRAHDTRLRRLIAGLLVMLTCVPMLGATLSFWVNRNLLRTDVWTTRTAPTIDDPAVQRAVSDAVTTQIMTIVDPKTLFESALADRGRILAVPLTSAVEDLVRARVAEFVAGERFHRMWNRLVEDGHRAAVATLRGQPMGVVGTADGTVTIDVIPAIDAVLARLTTQTPELFGRQVTIPPITVDVLPAVARDRLGDALGVDLDDDFGPEPQCGDTHGHAEPLQNRGVAGDPLTHAAAPGEAVGGRCPTRQVRDDPTERHDPAVGTGHDEERHDPEQPEQDPPGGRTCRGGACSCWPW